LGAITAAIRGKGFPLFAQRAVDIIRRYGITPVKMERALEQLVAILDRFGCSATLAIVAVVLGRHPRPIRRLHDRGIEFSIHGHRHIEYDQLSPIEQSAQLAQARRLFERAGLPPKGFRAPYLRASSDTLQAVKDKGLAYDGSQAISWDVLAGRDTPAYRHALGFYGALAASDYPSLPRLEDGLVRFPYSLPDDEALVHRLSLETGEQMSVLWLAVLGRSYQRGELFTLGLHPERILVCQEALAAVLTAARSLSPPVWIARLDQIAAWWRARAQSAVQITGLGGGEYRVEVSGPAGTTVLVRAAEVDGPTATWIDGYHRVLAAALTVRASPRPFVGISSRACPRLTGFLRQQGYILEVSDQARDYAHFFDRQTFTADQELALLAQIEGAGSPLLRLGRWPEGARSALAVTGDIDALTLWDFVLRLVGR
jgi:peptidoglycan/xylan/chitin deacetylase (PgdA/CDA1 family)